MFGHFFEIITNIAQVFFLQMSATLYHFFIIKSNTNDSENRRGLGYPFGTMDGTQIISEVSAK